MIGITVESINYVFVSHLSCPSVNELEVARLRTSPQLAEDKCRRDPKDMHHNIRTYSVGMCMKC